MLPVRRARQPRSPPIWSLFQYVQTQAQITLATFVIHRRILPLFPKSLSSTMDIYDTSLLQSIRRAARTSDPLATMLIQHRDDHFTPYVLNQANTALGELWNTESVGVCDALRCSALWGNLQSISSVVTVLIPRGILSHCTATYGDFNGARVNSHFIPLAMAMGPRLFQYLHDHDNPLVTSLISAWSPTHKAMGTTTFSNSISRMLQRDVSPALASDNKPIQKQIMKPISNFIIPAAVWRLWDSVQLQRDA